jgi:hypothetical protein
LDQQEQAGRSIQELSIALRLKQKGQDAERPAPSAFNRYNL